VSEEHVELAQRCLAGDPVALREFVETFQQQVFTLCLRMLRQRQDAEDAAQESLLRAVKYLPSWNSSQPLAPWVLKIASNRCRTALARRAKTPRSTDLAVQPAARSAAPTLGLAEELQSAIDELSENQRTCFVLFYQQELSIVDVARIMEVPEGTVKTWLHRSRKQLADRLRERGVTPG
jgi:RNA polymerase sigma-70 factor (ECF subfamily)